MCNGVSPLLSMVSTSKCFVSLSIIIAFSLLFFRATVNGVSPLMSLIFFYLLFSRAASAYGAFFSAAQCKSVLLNWSCSSKLTNGRKSLIIIDLFLLIDNENGVSPSLFCRLILMPSLASNILPIVMFSFSTHMCKGVFPYKSLAFTFTLLRSRSFLTVVNKLASTQ